MRIQALTDERADSCPDRIRDRVTRLSESLITDSLRKSRRQTIRRSPYYRCRLWSAWTNLAKLDDKGIRHQEQPPSLTRGAAKGGA